MEHAAAELLLEDWINARLAPGIGADVEAHVRACAECRGMAETLRALREAVNEHGEALFTDHPPAASLAQWASDPEALPLETLARIGAHLRACPTCRTEAALIRAAAAPSVTRALRAWWPIRPTWSDALRPALALLFIVLVWPAYLGVVEYPRLRAAAERSRDQARASRGFIGSPGTPAAPQSSAPAGAQWSGGGAGVLVLSGPTRGGGDRIPTVTLAAGQPAIAILSDRRPPEADSIRIAIRSASGAVVWRISARPAEVWSTRDQVMSLMVPTRVLAPGDFDLEVGTPSGPPSFRSRFRVVSPATH